MSEANPIVTLKAKIKEFGFSELKAGESNKSANSGETMYFDFPRMNFVINGKIIDTVLTSALIEGAQYRKSNLFNLSCGLANEVKLRNAGLFRLHGI